MSLKSSSHSSLTLTPPEDSYPVLDIDGSYYVTLPAPDDIAVGDLMVTIGASSVGTDGNPGSGTGYVPVGDGWTKIFYPIAYGWQWICWKFATEADVALTQMKFGPVAASFDVGDVAWLVYDGTDIRSILTATLETSRNVGGPATAAAPDITNLGAADATSLTFFSVNMDPFVFPTPDVVTVNDCTEQLDFDAWINASGTHGLPEIIIADETVAPGDPPAANLSTIPLPSTGAVVTVAVTLMLTGNRPPRTPTVLIPRTASTYTTIEDIPVALSGFIDPDPADSASACNLRYRLGAGAWTDLDAELDGTATIPALGAAGSYGVEGRYADQDAAASDWSVERTFTVIDPPPAPVITTPADDDTINAPTAPFDWTVTDQDKWQAQLIDDTDPTIVYWDSGLINADAARTGTAHYPVNNVAAHLRLRVFFDGHYSDWDDVPVTVAWTKPNKPVITAVTESDDDASIELTWTTALDSLPSDATHVVVYASTDSFVTRLPVLPAPGGTDPLPPSGTEVWYLPAHSTDYTFIVRAYNAYGAFNDSDPAG